MYNRYSLKEISLVMDYIGGEISSEDLIDICGITTDEFNEIRDWLVDNEFVSTDESESSESEEDETEEKESVETEQIDIFKPFLRIGDKYRLNDGTLTTCMEIQKDEDETDIYVLFYDKTIPDATAVFDVFGRVISETSIDWVIRHSTGEDFYRDKITQLRYPVAEDFTLSKWSWSKSEGTFILGQDGPEPKYMDGRDIKIGEPYTKYGVRPVLYIKG